MLNAGSGNRVFAISISTRFTTRKISKKRLTFKLLPWWGQPDLFNVRFTNIGTRTLVYRLTNTPGGWRISDIKYSEGPSLKEILSQEIK